MTVKQTERVRKKWKQTKQISSLFKIFPRYKVKWDKRSLLPPPHLKIGFYLKLWYFCRRTWLVLFSLFEGFSIGGYLYTLEFDPIEKEMFGVDSRGVIDYEGLDALMFGVADEDNPSSIITVKSDFFMEWDYKMNDVFTRDFIFDRNFIYDLLLFLGVLFLFLDKFLGGLLLFLFYFLYSTTVRKKTWQEKEEDDKELKDLEHFLSRDYDFYKYTYSSFYEETENDGSFIDNYYKNCTCKKIYYNKFYEKFLELENSVEKSEENVEKSEENVEKSEENV